jgi:hypothetical protein
VTIGVTTLMMAKVTPAPSMKMAPRSEALEEETWFMSCPFRNQFPKGYGKERQPASGNTERRQAGTGIPFSLIRTMTVGFGISPNLLTRTVGAFSAKVASTFAVRKRDQINASPALAGFGIAAVTAGGDFHPALRTHVQSSAREESRTGISNAQEATGM